MKSLPVVIVLMGASAGITQAVPVAKPPAPKPAAPTAPAKPTVEATEEALSDAIKKHDLAAATQILTQNPKLATMGEVPPLHQCGSENEVPIARLLVAKGAKWNAPVDGKTESGATALHFAASQGSLTMLQYLLGIGADINADKDTDLTPLQAALQNGRLGTAKWLLDKGADPNARDYNKQNALFYAVANPAEKGDPAAFVKTLIEKGADPNAKNSADETPLFQAVDPAITGALLAGGATIDIRNANGQTPLQRAIDNRRWKAAGTLLEKTDLSLVDDTGATPFDLVITKVGNAYNGDAPLADALLVVSSLQAKNAPRKQHSDTQILSSLRIWANPQYNQTSLVPVMLTLLPDSPQKTEIADNARLDAARAARKNDTLDGAEATQVAVILTRRGATDPALRTEGIELLKYAVGKLKPDTPAAQVEGTYATLSDAQRGDDKAQDATLEEFIARDPKNANARAIRGRARSDRGDHLRAIDDWNAAIQNAPADPSVGEWHFQRGYSFVMLQKWPLALTEFDAAEKGGVDKADLWNDRGYAKWKAGDVDGARADFARALQKEPLNFDAALNLADVARDGGKTADAVTAYNALVTQSREHPEASNDEQKSRVYSRLGEIFTRNKREEDAINNYRLSVQFHATAPALTNLADLLNFSKRNEEALKHATRATELDPTAGAPWYEKSLALLLLGRGDEALVAASKGIEVAPEEAQTYLVRANIYQSKGMSEEAKRDTEKARQLNNA